MVYVIGKLRALRLNSSVLDFWQVFETFGNLLSHFVPKKMWLLCEGLASVTICTRKGLKIVKGHSGLAFTMFCLIYHITYWHVPLAGSLVSVRQCDVLITQICPAIIDTCYHRFFHKCKLVFTHSYDCCKISPPSAASNVWETIWRVFSLFFLSFGPSSSKSSRDQIHEVMST